MLFLLQVMLDFEDLQFMWICCQIFGVVVVDLEVVFDMYIVLVVEVEVWFDGEDYVFFDDFVVVVYD